MDTNPSRKTRNTNYVPGNPSHPQRVSTKYHQGNHPSSAHIRNPAGTFGTSSGYPGGTQSQWDTPQYGGGPSSTFNTSHMHSNQNIDHGVLGSRLVTTQPRDTRQFVTQASHGRPSPQHSPVSPNSRSSNVPRSPHTSDMTGDRPALTAFTLGESSYRVIGDQYQQINPSQHNIPHFNLSHKK